MKTKLPAWTRPNGTVYRPRKITAEFFVDQDQVEEGIVVLGTHDYAVARYRAMHLADMIGMMAVDPELRWVRLVMRRGEPMYEEYPETGRACVWFKGLVEMTNAQDFPLPKGAPSPPLRSLESYRGSNMPTGTQEPGNSVASYGVNPVAGLGAGFLPDIAIP